MADRSLSTLYRAHVDTLQQRFEQTLEGADFDGIAIFAGTETTPPRDDVAYPFRVEPYFKQWAPIGDAPGSVLIVTPGARPRLIHAQPDDFWHAPARDPDGDWSAYFDIDVARSDSDIAARLRSRVRGLAAIGEPGTQRDLGFHAVNDPALISQLDYLRAFKTDWEIECIRRAAGIAVRGHLAAAQAFTEQASEFDLDQAYRAATRQTDAELPYPNIVALNEHAAILHYQRLERTAPPQHRSFLLDAGARFNGYASDVTRTLSGDRQEFRALLAAVDALQQTVCAHAVPGTDFIELNDLAHRLLANVLAEHRIVTCTAQEAYERGITHTFLPHGLGHLLGLQVHDPGGRQIAPDGETRPPPPEHPALRLTRRLEPGFVVTIEPGIYFIPSLLAKLTGSARRGVAWETVERLLPFGGIRVEDDLAVGTADAVNMSRAAFART